MTDLTCKLLILGAGPGGYVCAIRAGQLGVDTVIVDPEPPGGTCLNVGCIPSKALIHAAEEFHRLVEIAGGGSPLGITATAPAMDLSRAKDWKDGIVRRLNEGVSTLMKRAKVRHVTGRAVLRDGKSAVVQTAEGEIRIEAEAVVIATGSAPVEVPSLPFGGKVISSTGALALTEVPKTLAVVGGGYIGLELGTAFAKLGAKVTAVEAAGKILPQYDAELTRPVAARLEALGVRVLTGAKAEGLGEGGGLRVWTTDGHDEIDAEKVLVTVGRRPVTAGIGLENLGLEMDGSFIRVDGRCRASMRGVYAIGDVTGEPMLAHRAMAQGEMVAEIVAGQTRSWDRRVIPAVCFTDPEIVTVGLSPDQARAEGHEVLAASFPFQANGRAMTTGREDGFVRVVARKEDHLVLGLQAVGAGVSELSAAFALVLENAMVLEDVTGTIHAHPTQGEALHEACLRALGHALHI
ncbi:dihydrolipoyl dehydrogenase [Frigidibacter sp. MR17.14]|uniref:dihydrolipoyl dehydrogenase n=1 Tax=Frigidibacter sp. MR17.14 TaxID=3126509 RepID=UPI003012E3C3